MIKSQTENGFLIRVPQTFHGYKVLDIIGCGSTSIVTLVEDLDTGKRYSAKIISCIDIEKQKLTYSIEKEIAILKEVDHPNIIKMKENFNIKNKYNEEFIVLILEYCENGDLLTLATSNKIKNNFQLKTILYSFLQSIKYLHSRFISHGDIKAENILLTSKNVAKLCDFGYCRTTFVAGDDSKNGTLYYAAPELFYTGEFNPLKTDIYAIGITLYSISELQFPFRDGDRNYIVKQIVSGNLSLRPGMDKKLKNLVLKCTALDPENRPTIDEILNDEYFDSCLRKKINSKDNNLGQNSLLIEKQYSYLSSSSSSQEKSKVSQQSFDSNEYHLNY